MVMSPILPIFGNFELIPLGEPRLRLTDQAKTTGILFLTSLMSLFTFIFDYLSENIYIVGVLTRFVRNKNNALQFFKMAAMSKI